MVNFALLHWYFYFFDVTQLRVHGGGGGERVRLLPHLWLTSPICGVISPVKWRQFYCLFRYYFRCIGNIFLLQHIIQTFRYIFLYSPYYYEHFEYTQCMYTVCWIFGNFNNRYGLFIFICLVYIPIPICVQVYRHTCSWLVTQKLFNPFKDIFSWIPWVILNIPFKFIYF